MQSLGAKNIVQKSPGIYKQFSGAKSRGPFQLYILSHFPKTPPILTAMSAYNNNSSLEIYDNVTWHYLAWILTLICIINS
uniref:Ovule protein n=1 Tax=Romanomermis culicivorax TaxID=13658 RepID=A0A915HNL8_ROMCU